LNKSRGGTKYSEYISEQGENGKKHVLKDASNGWVARAYGEVETKHGQTPRREGMPTPKGTNFTPTGQAKTPRDSYIMSK